MATFADYQAQTMGSNDFTLYPYTEVWNQDQTYLPPSSFPEQPYITATTFDSYPSQEAYVQPEQYSFPLDPSFHTKENLQSLSPNYSPTNSAAHSFDLHNPPRLSSDSGASVQSSAIGSPSVQPQHPNEWNAHQGFLPAIVQPELLGGGVFATTGFDFDSIPATDKGCVGELTTISSSQLSQNVHSVDFAPYSSSFAFLRDQEANARASGVNGWLFPSDAPTPTGTQRTLSLQSTPSPRTRGNSVDCPSPNDSLFKSPSTPASASSPVLERVKGKRKGSVAPTPPKRARVSSPLTQTMSYAESDLPMRPQAPAPTLNSPFFYQSSGHFVPPLDYSCPSPSLSRI